MEKEINWRGFYHSVFTMVIPIALQNLINVSVTAADVFMLGKAGETVLSGASLAGQVQFVMTLFFFGVTSGATVLTAQYWGKQDTRTIEKVLGIGLGIGLLTALVFAAAATLFPNALMHIYSADEDVIAEGVKYLRIVGVSYLFMAVTQVYLSIMRSIQKVLIATFVYLTSLFVNIILNALLIFGLFGFPRLGIVGAAIGTLCSRIAETAIVLIYACLKNKSVQIRFQNLIHIDRLLFRDFITYAMPVIINEALWGLGSSTNTAIIGHLGSAAVAANSVAQVARQLATVVAFGVSNATAVYLGKTIGEGQMELAKAYSKRFIWLSIVMGSIGGGLILLSAPFVKAVLVLSDEARQYLGFMFFVMSYFTVAQSLNTTTIVGIFRSGGDTKFGLYLEIFTLWGGSILFGTLAAFVFHAPVRVVYVILMIDEVIKVPIAQKRYRGYRWLRDVTR